MRSRASSTTTIWPTSLLQGAFLYVDVGGGSTEISFICNGQRIFGQSFNVGTIRLLKGKVKKNDLMALKTEVTKVTSGYDNIKIIGSGGNINKLFRLANKKKKLEALPVDVLHKLYDSLSKMSVEERMVAYELKPGPRRCHRAGSGDLPACGSKQ